MTGSVGLKPHPSLPRYYGTDEQRPKVVRQMFDVSAPHYNLICRLMSVGSGRMYRRMALLEAGLKPGMRMLDVATGTGLVAEAAVRILGGAGGVVAIDYSPGMLKECRKAVDVPLVRAKAEELPLGDQSFDLLSMAYALRHMSDLEAVFREYLRVLKPGGRLLLLEFTRPSSQLGFLLARTYLKKVVPWITLLGTCSRDARRLMEYCWDTVDQCVPPAAILEALRGAGFHEVERRTSSGLLSEYVARCPPART